MSVLLIRGSSGVGKSSAVRALRAVTNGAAVIDVDDIWSMLSAARWSPDEHPIALIASAALARSFAGAGRQVFLACSTTDAEHQIVVDALAGVRVRCLLLVADNKTLARRIVERHEIDANAYHDVAEALRLNDEICAVDCDSLDSSAISIDEVALRIVAYASGVTSNVARSTSRSSP